jgi:acetoin utilization protein AcuC
MTTKGYSQVIQELKRLSPGKWVAFGGGGYDVLQVPRAWTLAWAIMNNVELPDTLPAQYCALIRHLGSHDGHLRDKPYQTSGAAKRRILQELEKTLAYIKEHQLKMVCGQSGGSIDK